MRKQKKSLSDEELALSAANGDDESMALLISAITPIAKAKGYALADSRVAGEDLTQEGMLGFLEAVKGFNPEKGGFKTYAETCINNRILSAVRASYNNKNAALSKAVPYETSDVDVTDSGTDPADIVSEKETSEHIRELLSEELSDFEKQVIDLRLLDMSYSQIAQKLGCSDKAVDNALQRIRKKMRTLLGL